MRGPGPLFLLLCAHPGAGQRLQSYNLWVCPHCEGGTKAADVSDLKCEGEAANSGGVDWRWVKSTLHGFLRSLAPQANSLAPEDVRRLMDLAATPAQGECYLGIVALGFFAFNFMDADERRHFLRSSIFGGVTFRRTVPLSYWDTYASGWPIFGLLAVAGELVQQDLASSQGIGAKEVSASPDVGMTGIDLGPRSCCDFPGSAADEEDRIFLLALTRSLGGFAWLARGPALPLRLPLQYLAASAHRGCSWGRATAYLALAEASLLGSKGKEASRSLFSLGEHNLDGCEANTTVYHLMQSVWPFWQVLGRLEQRGVLVEASPAEHLGERFGDTESKVPRPSRTAVERKWRHYAKSRRVASPAPVVAAAPSLAGSHACMQQQAGLAHVALSADLKQVDGIVATLSSAVKHAGESAKRLCFHAFALPQHRAFLREALQCAFGAEMEASSSGEEEDFHFRLNGSAHLLLHLLDAAYVRRKAGLPAESEEEQVMVGELDVRRALRADTGNLGAVHNFVRFALDDLLLHLQRVVYLDVDVLVKADLSELYHSDALAGGAGTIAAVVRGTQPLRVYVDVLQPAVPAWLPSEAPSFNAGVMLIDLQRWRQRQVSKLVAEWLSLNAHSRLWLHGSQPPLLLLFHDEVAPLHWTWNVDGLGHRLNYPKEVLRQARVLHWTGPLKPWRQHGVNRLLWEPYMREYCPRYSFREHTTTCRPDSWFC